MIIFLYGPDDYRRTQKKKAIIAEFEKKRSGLGIASFDFDEYGEKEGLDAFGGFLRNRPIFEAARLAVVENAFEIDAKKLAAVLAPIISEKGLQVLIVERDKPVKALAFLLEKPVLSQKFEALVGAELVSFIKEEGKKRGIAFADSAAAFLATVYVGQSWAAVTEIEKLASLKGAPVDASGAEKTGFATITRRDLDAFDLEAAPNYWALLNGMKSFDIHNRMQALETLLGINDPPAKIFNILSAQAGEKIGRMAAYDLAVKSGKLEYEEALVDLALG
jgi:DNA polymerase III delta subunit